MRILVINGPSLNLLGIREPHIYGNLTYLDLEKYIEKSAAKLGMIVTIFQSNHEGAIIDAIHTAINNFDGIVINAAAYSHTSIAIMDALKGVNIPAVEVHISNLAQREQFRQFSYVSLAVLTTISGHGFTGYKEAMEFLINKAGENK